jgi:glycosyltransferase involved in cell wall biosynthesis
MFVEMCTLSLSILTRSLPPHICGIGDHSLNLARSLRDCGHSVELIACRGSPDKGAVIVGDEIDAGWVEQVKTTVARLRIEVFILQFTPHMYNSRGRTWRRDLINLWSQLSLDLATALIVHETYFRTLRHPPSFLRGTREKNLLQELCRSAHHVFTASETIANEIKGWGEKRSVVVLPIGSNIPVASADIGAMRARYDVDPRAVVLTLFGGGNNLIWARRHIDYLQQRLEADRIPHVWLLLGWVPRTYLKFTAPVLDPGRLTASELSAHLQMTDIFLMPHWSGVNARRGTLMAALEHGLAVVGTRGYSTEPFWNQLEGVCLIDVQDVESFCDKAVRLAKDPQGRRDYGQLNRAAFIRHFTWNSISKQFLEVLSMTKPHNNSS